MPETGTAPGRDTARVPSDTNQTTPSSKASMGLLDTVFILMLACIVVLLVTFLGTTLGGNTVLDHIPDWLMKIASSIWTYLTGAASSAFLYRLRDQTTPRPNYLLWTFGTAAILLGLTFGVFALVGSHRELQPASLHFSLHLINPCQSPQQNCPPVIAFSETSPNMWIEKTYISADPPGNLTFEPADPHYHLQNIDWPGKDEQFLALTNPAVEDAHKAGATDPTHLCFSRSITVPKSSSAINVRMKCAEGKECTLLEDGPQWAGQCSQKTGDSRRSKRTVAVVYAAETDKVSQSGWQVPSLKTLASMNNERKVGYTEFTISGPIPDDLKRADNYRYLITANGEPLYVDGWPPEDMIEPLKPSEGLNFKFGLQNLSFSGADNGCENIQVALEFRQRDRVVRQVTLSRRYAALRDAGEELISKDGTEFAWRGTYKKPPNEDKFEAFVASTSNLADALKAKKQLDDAGLLFNGMSVVGVLRPPLDKPRYGIAAGLRQPSGQIRFTFDRTESGTLFNWLLAKRREQVQLRNAIRPDAFRYEMRPGESGVGKLNSCPANHQ
jgi:hypothetical protein